MLVTSNRAVGNGVQSSGTRWSQPPYSIGSSTTVTSSPSAAIATGSAKSAEAGFCRSPLRRQHHPTPEHQKEGVSSYCHRGSDPIVAGQVLQSVIEKPFWHISIDHLRDAGVLPPSASRAASSPGGMCAVPSSTASTLRSALMPTPATISFLNTYSIPTGGSTTCAGFCRNTTSSRGRPLPSGHIGGARETTW